MYLKLKQFSKVIINNPFLTGSLVMVFGSNLYNLSQFVFHFLAGRFLGKVAYGDLAAIISLIGIIVIIQSALGMTVVRFIASAKHDQEVHNFIKWVYLWTKWIAVILAVLTLLLSPILIHFLNITQPMAFYLLSPILFFYIMANTGRSILQGLLKFYPYVLSLMSEAVIKIPLAILLMVIGLSTFGAFGGLLVGVILSFIIIKSSLSIYLSGQKGTRPEIVPLLKYSSATFFQGLALTSMYSTDLVLVKHFFPADQAGIYASLAVLGRIVFFGASPVTHVMFPIVTRKHSSGEPYRNIFYLSLLLVIGFSLMVIALFYFFPNIIIGTLYGSSFIEGSKMLWWFGIFMGLLSLAMLLTQFYLSLGKTKVVILFIAAALLQIFLIWMYHPNLLMVIQLSIVSATLLIVSLFIYSLYYLLK